MHFNEMRSSCTMSHKFITPYKNIFEFEGSTEVREYFQLNKTLLNKTHVIFENTIIFSLITGLDGCLEWRRETAHGCEWKHIDIHIHIILPLLPPSFIDGSTFLSSAAVCYSRRVYKCCERRC